jgi:acetylornithine deacetylase
LTGWAEEGARERALEILADLIAFPSVSSRSNLDIAAYICDALEPAGAEVAVFRDASGGKANVFATIGPKVDGGTMLAGHTDVVAAEGAWWADPFGAVRSGERIVGRGACDMKAFLACMLASAPGFAKARLKRPLHLAFTYDEELGCLGARELARLFGHRLPMPAACIVGEPTDMRIVDAHKGCFEYTTTFVGLEGHASTPERGVNAVHFAARFVSFLLDLGERMQAAPPEGSPFDPPSTTIQVGRITGGEARNIIARECTVEWEFRPVTTADATMVRQSVQNHLRDVLLPQMRAVVPAAAISTEVVGEVAGLAPEPGSAAVRLMGRLGCTDKSPPVSFGTEAGLYQAAGISTVLCGPGSIAQAHTVDEFIEISQIQRCLGMMKRLQAELERET